MAQIIKNEQILPVDIDGTLIFWGKIRKGQKCISFICPYTAKEMHVGVMEANVAIVRERLARGAVILAWSASGYKKAAVVMKALGLMVPNVVVLSKPVGYLDDIDCSEWMGKRIWLDADSKYSK